MLLLFGYDAATPLWLLVVEGSAMPLLARKETVLHSGYLPAVGNLTCIHFIGQEKLRKRSRHMEYVTKSLGSLERRSHRRRAYRVELYTLAGRLHVTLALQRFHGCQHSVRNMLDAAIRIQHQVIQPPAGPFRIEVFAHE